MLTRSSVPTLSFLTTALLAASAQAAPPPADPTTGCPALISTSNLMVRSYEPAGCYIREVQFESDAVCDNGSYSSPPAARVYLPRGYYAPANAQKFYPVVYLLHGGNESAAVGDDSYRSWTSAGDAYGALGNYDMILVTPEAGRLGFYTNWADVNDRPTYEQNPTGSLRFGCNDGVVGPCCLESGSPPPAPGAGVLDYERYQFEQVIPWVEKNFRALKTRDKRAIAGLSMGGYGATKYAAKHPDMFVSVGAFSGALNAQDHNAALGFPWNQGAGQAELLKAVSTLIAGTSSKMFGTDDDADVRWSASNPTRLAENLRGLDIFVSAGTGCTVFDANCDLGSSHFETAGVGNVTQDFLNALASAPSPSGSGTSAITYFYAPIAKETHDWPNWKKVLPMYLSRVNALFYPSTSNPPAVLQKPSVWSHVTSKSSVRVYGWEVYYRDANNVPQPSDVRLNRIAVPAANKFSVEGTGFARLYTAPQFTPGATYRVTFSNPAVSIPAQVVTANSLGGLLLSAFVLANSGSATTTLTFTKL